MTMQVGMVGTDGIVLASDTKWIDHVNRAPLTPIRSISSKSKIKISHKRGIVISYARNMETSGPIADSIIAELTDSDMAEPEIPIENLAAKVIKEATEKPGNRIDVHCLIVLSRPTLRLFRVRTIGYTAPCEEIIGQAVAGDVENSAVFWPELYYRELPVRHLARLAAQFIVMAGKIHSGSIGGLEVVLCDSSGFHRLSADSNRRLESAANETHERLLESFISYAEQFTYAPDVVG